MVEIREVLRELLLQRGGSGFRCRGLLVHFNSLEETMMVGLETLLIQVQGVSKVEVMVQKRGEKAWIEVGKGKFIPIYIFLVAQTFLSFGNTCFFCLVNT